MPQKRTKPSTVAEFGTLIIFKKILVLSTLLLFFGTHGNLFSPDERSCYNFRPETIIANFLHLMMLICKVFINHFSKRQFVVLLVAVGFMIYFSPAFYP